MKHLYLLLFLLPLFSGCRHESAKWEFLVFLENWGYPGDCTLVMTNMQGEVVAEIEDRKLRNIQNELRIPMINDGYDEEYGLHVISHGSVYSLSGQVGSRITSYLGVKNGMSVNMNRYYGPFGSAAGMNGYDFTIKNIPAPPIIWYMDKQVNVNYSSTTQIATFQVQSEQGATLLLIVKAGTASRQWILKPGSSTLLKWADGQPTETVSRDVEVPPINPNWGGARQCAYLVSPNFTEWMPLAYNEYWEVTAPFTFTMPAHPPTDWMIHVAQQQGLWAHAEELFSPHASLNLQSNEIKIKERGFNAAGDLYIHTSGPVDLLNVEAYDQAVHAYVPIFWNLKGRPKQMTAFSIPRLESYLPIREGRTCRDLFSNLTITAYYLPNIGDQELSRGFPWVSSTPFPLVQNGVYREVSVKW